MICRLCLNALDEQDAVLLFGGNVPPDATQDSDSEAPAAAAAASNSKPVPESYLVKLISIHLYLCLSRDDAISTCICPECCGQLESFHNFWQLVELKQTTLSSQFLEIDCDVNWSEEGDVVDVDEAASPCQLLKEELPEFAEPKIVAAAAAAASAANKFPCMFCEKSFKMRRYLEEHVATHTGDRPIACPYCEMAFRCRSNMYTHVKSKHTIQWLKAREERDAAKSQNQLQAQPEVPSEPAVIEEQQQQQHPPPPPPLPLPQPSPPQPLPLSAIKSDSLEAINLTMAKTSPSTTRTRTTRSSRRKTQSPKKVQSTECHASDGDGDGDADAKDNNSSSHEHHPKRLKENELMLANYNAVAAAVVAAASFNDRTSTGQADSLQQRLRASLLMQQQQQDLFTAMTAAAASTSAATTVTTGGAGALSHPYSLKSVCSSVPGMLDKRRHRMEDNAPLSATATPIICPSCGELPGHNHRCLTKPKYACEVCGKCFKMKRYLEEHFATHTGVKLHTCSFCPTEFRSKSNMYHHTKRKHKAEWERSRATRTAAAAKTVQPVGSPEGVQDSALPPAPTATSGHP
ncbi:zinc finger protein 574 isoform X1 [Drosophila subobscura]|uniref:zinc finger protein 574 isoform X1 n=1 Tax=Drosophila subobscura TaxID=7241 RepID=UPI00155A31A1|nr:zinc finger protein 574 isoform X1 [Drosophila subobscura]